MESQCTLNINAHCILQQEEGTNELYTYAHRRLSLDVTFRPFNTGDRKHVGYDPKLIIRLTYKTE